MIKSNLTLEEALKKSKKGRKNMWSTPGNPIDWQKHGNVQAVLVMLEPEYSVYVSINDPNFLGKVQIWDDISTFEEITDRYPCLTELKGSLYIF